MTTWFTAADVDLEAFRAVCEQKTELTDYPHATDVVKNVLLYPAALPDTPDVRAELIRALRDGPGVLIFAGPSTRRWSTAPHGCSPT